MNLSLGFPEPAQERILARQSGLSGAIERFEQWMADPESPVRAVRRQAARPGEFAEFPETLAPPLQKALVARGIDRLYTHQAEAFSHAVGRTQRGDRDAHRQRQDAVLQPAGVERTAGRSQRPRDVSVPDQGSGRRPTGRVSEGRRRDGVRPPRFYLRWRYAAGCAPGHPRARQRRLHQSRHAPLGRPPASHQVGQGVRESALRGDRRAALLSRRLRQPSGESAAPAETRVRVLWIVAAIHLLLGDHRQSQGAGRGAYRSSPSSWWSATVLLPATNTSCFTIRRW